MNYPPKLYNWFLDLIFPIKCLSCGDFGFYLCRKCANTISIKKRFECIGCKVIVNFGETCPICSRSNYVDRLLIVADYNDTLVERTIKLFKYRFIREAADPLFVLVARYLKWLNRERGFNIFQGNPLIIPVPLHRERLNWRGFNQSEILAEKISLTYQMNIETDLLVRTKKTTPQADVEDKEARLLGTKGIFSFNPDFKNKISGRDIILIDDICTTGATLNECARILKENGAGKITALVIARG